MNLLSYQLYRAPALSAGTVWNLLTTGDPGQTNFVFTNSSNQEYFQAGVRRVWVVYPTERLVYAYASPTGLRVLGAAESLDGEDVLPGLRLPVADLFEDTAGAEG